MKIGILTLPLHTNYGGILQAYALQTVLKCMGHDAWIIKRGYREYSFFYYYYVLAKELTNKYILKKNLFIIFSKKEKKRIDTTRMQYIQEFINKYLQPCTEAYNSSTKLRNNIAEYHFDAYIVGSDQVWRCQYARDILYDFFLGFIRKNESVRRVSYAASFGIDQWEFSEKQTDICSQLIGLFDAVSVREHSGTLLCSRYLGINAKQVLDPTLLLDKSDYENLIRDQPKEQRQLLSYILDNTEDKTNGVSELASFFNQEMLSFNNPNPEYDMNAALEDRKAYPVEIWLAGFRDATFVITDSFHACVFSILFKKPFFVYANEIRGLTRIRSLLNLFGLENRMIFSSKDITKEKLEKEIDWNNVYGKLEQERIKSYSFLKQALMQ
jgi:hypothetical protein